MAPPPTSKKQAAFPPLSESISSVDMTSPAPFPTTAMLPSSSTSVKPLFSAFSSSSDLSWNFSSSWCLKPALSSVIILPSNARILPSFNIATGLISASSASFSIVSFDNLCTRSTNSLMVLSLRPIAFATSSATDFSTLPRPTSRIT